jgi:hypothetical protein
MQAIFIKIINNLNSIFGWGNPSITSIYANFASVFSSVIYSIEQEIINTQNNIESAIGNNRFGKPEWYISYALAFQTGYNVKIDTNNPSGFLPYYEIIDDNAQIISQAAFSSEIISSPIDGQPSKVVNTLTVASFDTTTGFLIPLTSQQLIEFKSYMGITGETSIVSGNVQIPGIPLLINSLPPNVISYASVNVYYKSNYDINIIKSNVILQMLNFVKKTTLGATFRTNLLEQYMIQNVQGIVDFAVQDPSLLQENGSYQPIIDEAFLSSGYFNFFENYQDYLIFKQV